MSFIGNEAERQAFNLIGGLVLIGVLVGAIFGALLVRACDSGWHLQSPVVKTRGAKGE